MASKYKEIVKYLRDNYINNASSPKKLPSEPQLSKMLGVSRFPVNRAISNLIECGEVTRLPGVGTFIKGFEPESYRQKKQQKGIIVVSFTGTVNAEIFHGIQEIVLSQKVQLANLFEKGKSNKVNYKPETLKSVVNTDEFGLLVIPPLEFEDDKHNSFKALLEEAEHNNYPMVIMERPCVEFDGPQVVIDNAGGTAMAVETMLKNGFEKVAYIGKDDYLVGKERAKGYFRAYRENGLDINQDLIAIDRNGENFMNQIGQFTANSMDRILDKNPDCSAFMTFGIAFAHQIYIYLKKRGLFHENIKISGYDQGTFQEKEFLSCYIALRRPLFEVGKDSASTLLDIMNSNGEMKIFTKKILPDMILSTNRSALAFNAHL